MADQNSFPSDSELLRAIKIGDEQTQPEAKNKLVAKHNEKLKNSILSYLRWKKCNYPVLHVKGVLNQTWINAFGNPVRHAVEPYGMLTSLRVWYQQGLEVEFGFGDEHWPHDAGAQAVMQDGMKVLLDRALRFRIIDREA